MTAGAGGNEGGDEIAGTITTVHRYDLPGSRQEVWDLISDVSRYREWWPWLRVFDAAALAPGEEWRCEVQPPAPYLVRFRVVIQEVEAATSIRATVLGDVVGRATLQLQDAGPGCTATLDSALAPGNAALRLVSRFGGPIARVGHDWVLNSGARQFISRAAKPGVGE